MNIESKDLEKNKKELKVELTALEVAPIFEKAYKELSQELDIPGFRKGKAPKEEVKKNINQSQIFEKVARLAINENYFSIIKKQDLEPAGPPEVEVLKIAEGNPFVFKLRIPLLPSVSLCDYEDINVKPEKIDIKDKEVENTINRLQQSRSTEKKVDRKAKEGDKVKLDLKLQKDGKDLENGDVKDYSFVIGKQAPMPGLSDNLKGAKSGDEKEFSHTYPKEHYDKNLAGKKIDFKAKIKDVYEITLPELNDEFAKSFGDFKTMEDLRSKIKDNIKREKEQKNEQKIESEVLDQLVEKSKFDEIPESLIDHEVEKMLKELEASLQNSPQGGKIKFDDYLESINKTKEDLKKDFKPKAQKRVKTALAIKKIAEKENIQATDKDLEQEIARLKKIYKGQDKMIKNLEQESSKLYLKDLLTNRKVIKFLKDKALK